MYEKTLSQPLTIPNTSSASAREILYVQIKTVFTLKNQFFRAQMLNKNRAERLGARTDFEEIRDHQFFASIDWEKLLRREIKPPFVPKVRCETDTVNISREFIEIEPNAGE